MKHYAVIGHPIGHSLSPLMHNTAFKLLGIDGHYEALDIEPGSLKQTTLKFREHLWGGFNITTPFKEAVIPLIDEVIPEAQGVGAVNTIVQREMRLIGYNTDVIGIEQSLNPERANIDGQHCTIMGAGGVARSITYVLVNKFRPRSITFAALYPEQAHAIIESIGRSETKLNVVPFIESDIESAVKNSILIINATTVGMYPKVLESPLTQQQWLSSHHIVFDLIYRPLKTRLLRDAQSIGAKTIDGLGMFLHQGAAAFQLWTGKHMPMEPVREILENILQADIQ
jgi:shikimate dehydrogenase